MTLPHPFHLLPVLPSAKSRFKIKDNCWWVWYYHVCSNIRVVRGAGMVKSSSGWLSKCVLEKSLLIGIVQLPYIPYPLTHMHMYIVHAHARASKHTRRCEHTHATLTFCACFSKSAGRAVYLQKYPISSWSSYMNQEDIIFSRCRNPLTNFQLLSVM